MKTTIALIALLTSLAPAFAQFQQPPPQISVSGSAEIRVVPDEIRLSVAVESRSDTLAPARMDNDTRVAGALAFLKQSGIADCDVKTDFISVHPDYDYNRSRVIPAAYIVRKSIEVKLTNTMAFQAIVTGLLTNGVNIVEGADFRTTQLRKYRDEARAMAVRAAREKAKAMTEELGAKLGRPYNINANDNSSYWGRNVYLNGSNSIGNNSSSVGSSGSADNASDAFAVGQISVTANVNVTFLIE